MIPPCIVLICQAISPITKVSGASNEMAEEEQHLAHSTLFYT